MVIKRAPVVIAIIGLLLHASGAAAQENDGIRMLLSRLENITQTGDAVGYFSLLAPAANRDRARDFASRELLPGASRAVLQERDRIPLASVAPTETGFRLLVDVFADFGTRARIATWRIDILKTGDAGAEREWSILDEDHLSSVENIYRLSLDTTKAFAAHDLKLAAEDLDLSMPEGTVFVASVDQGVTGAGPDRPRHGVLPSHTRDRARTGQDFLRQRGPRDPFRGGLRPDQPERFRAHGQRRTAAGASRSIRASCGGRRTFSARSRRSRSSSTSAI